MCIRDRDKAYDDLKKQMDLAKVSMPDEVEDPIMLELNANLMANMILAVSKDNTDNLYNYVNDDVVPEQMCIRDRPCATPWCPSSR